jgi:hypothetical protein
MSVELSALPRLVATLMSGVLAGCMLSASSAGAAVFRLVASDHVAAVLVPTSEPECVRRAAEDLASDVEKITGRAPTVVRDPRDCQADCVVLASMDRPESVAVLEKFAPGFGSGLKGRWEAYRIETVDSRLIIAGSDERGTMFGLYAFIERYVGVDPLYFWASRRPQRRATLVWDNVQLRSDGPSFRFRGWFINDEDLLTEWKDGGGKREIDYPFYGQVVSREVIRAVAEALVRSRFNLTIPASFVDILNPPEAALVEECARRGVFVSQHHVEPLGVSAFSYFNYWQRRGRDLKYSYYSHPAEVREVWRVYAEKWSVYPNVIWQLGLRGIADRPMWLADPNTPQSDADRGRLISEAMAAQVKILDELRPHQPRYLSTTLWAEGSALHQQGLLTIPEETIVVFADNSPGWKWQRDFYSTPRNPKNTYGVYYHHGLIGSGPHLAQVTSPDKTFECLKTAVENQAGSYAIFNVSNIREFVLGIDATAKMTWQMESFDPDTWLAEWIRERFSRRQAEIADAYRTYFNAWQIHPKQQVPFLMDGQMFSAGNTALGQIMKQLQDRQHQPKGHEKTVQAAPPQRSDAFWSALSDMHPRNLGRRETIQRLVMQKDGLALAMRQAQAAAAELPGPEATLLGANLIYQSAIMVRACTWLEQVERAHEALDLGDRPACATALTQAEAAFARIPVLAEGYCRGTWTHWYRGCKKLNVSATLKRTRDVLEKSRQVSPR